MLSGIFERENAIVFKFDYRYERVNEDSESDIHVAVDKDEINFDTMREFRKYLINNDIDENLFDFYDENTESAFRLGINEYGKLKVYFDVFFPQNYARSSASIGIKVDKKYFLKVLTQYLLLK